MKIVSCCLCRNLMLIYNTSLQIWLIILSLDHRRLIIFWLETLMTRSFLTVFIHFILRLCMKLMLFHSSIWFKRLTCLFRTFIFSENATLNLIFKWQTLRKSLIDAECLIINFKIVIKNIFFLICYMSLKMNTIAATTRSAYFTLKRLYSLLFLRHSCQKV